MPKKCTVCGEEEAKFYIKGTNNYYCEECARELFNDISLLKQVDEQAKKLKQEIDEQEQEEPENEDQ